MHSLLKIPIILLCGAVFAAAGFFGATILFDKTKKSVQRDESTTGSDVVLKVAGRTDRLDWQAGGMIIFGLIGVGGAAGVIMFFEKKQSVKQKKPSATTSQKRRKSRSTNPASQERPVKQKRRRKRSE